MKQQPITLPITREAKLMHLYSIIEAAPAEQMNITHWACGTSYCVAGWACQDPVFNKMGLKLTDTGLKLTHSMIRAPISKYGGCDHGLKGFFGLSTRETSFLFHDYINRDGEGAKQEALAKIEELMR